MKVGIIGLGVLGIANVAILSSLGHEIVAYDSNAFLVSLVKRKVKVIKDEKTRQAMEDNSDHINYTSDINDLLMTDIIVIALDLLLENGKYNLNNFYYVIDMLKEMHGNKTILIRTPLPYGTCATIEKYFNDTKGNLELAYEPLNTIDDLGFDTLLSSNPLVIGTDSELAHMKIVLLYEKRILKGTKVFFVSYEEAELYRVALIDKYILQKTYLANIQTLCNDYNCSFDNLKSLIDVSTNYNYQNELGCNHKTLVEQENLDFFLRKEYNLNNSLNESNNILANQILKCIKGHNDFGIFGVSDHNGELHPLVIALIKLLLANGCLVAIYDSRNEENLKKFFTNKNLKYAVDPKSLLKKANTILLLTDTEDLSLIKEDFYLKFGNENTVIYDFAHVYAQENWSRIQLIKVYNHTKAVYKFKEKAPQS